MTCVINVIHNEFCILTADVRAITKGPTTFQLDNIQIKCDNWIQMNGYNKIHINENKTCAIGIAGEANRHTYIPQFSQSVDSQSAIESILRYANDNFTFNPKLIANEEKTQCTGILTFFEKDTEKFYSFNYFLYKNITGVSPHQYKCIQLIESKNEPLFFPIGSGSVHF